MFVFNTTFVIEGAMVDVWDQWMSVNYFPLIKEIVPGAVVDQPFHFFQYIG